jgi:hypothetical protein
MTTPNGLPPFNGSLFSQGSTIQDSLSTSTDRTANNVLSNGKVVHEMLIRFEYVQIDNNTPVHVLQYHSNLITTIIHEQSNHVTIYDKNNKLLDLQRMSSLSSLAHLRDLCNVNTRQNGKARHVIIMALRTAKSFIDIKNTTLVTTKLKQFNAYIAEHKFGITEWDITSLGWFRNLHPSLLSYNLVKNYIIDEVKANCRTPRKKLQSHLINC